MDSMEINGNQWIPWKSMEIHRFHANFWKSISKSIDKASSGYDHADSGGVSEANSGHDGSGDRDLTAKPESQSQNDHTNGGREGRGMMSYQIGERFKIDFRYMLHRCQIEFE